MQFLPTQAFPSFPPTLRDELVDAFNEIVVNFREGKWEPSELNGGKFCEVVYSVLRGHVDGILPIHAAKPRNMVSACQALESASLFPRSVRIQIPRLLVALYEIRNNRGVGHVGGEVNSNQMDATFILSAAKWILADLVRIFHNVDIQTATGWVDAITTRDISLIWDTGEKKRVLNTELTMKQKTLALLYSSSGALREKELFSWVEHSNAAVFRRDVLRRAHAEKLIEFDEVAKTVKISPLGSRYVEEEIL